MTTKFERAHAVTAKWEGGWSNHAADPGGKTMYGVTEAVFHAWLRRQGKPVRPVRTIAMTEALAIYLADYWTPVNGERLFPGVDLAVYDTAVNSGVSRGKKLLVAGLDPQNRHDRTVRNNCARRMSFLRALRHWRSFGKGWTNRVADVEAKGVAWALSAMKAPPANVPVLTPRPVVVRDVAAQLEDESRKAANASKSQRSGAVTSGSGAAAGGGAAATPALDPSAMTDWGAVAVIAAIVALVGLAAFLAYRSRVNASRAAAYTATVQELDANDVG